MIIVYTPGRVGTVALRTNLSRHIEGEEIFGVHSFYRETAIDGICRDHNSNLIGLEKFGKLYDEMELKKQIKVLTCVRDPVERALSAYFFFHNNWKAPINSPNREHIGRFIEVYNHDWALDWFDWEVKAIFGLDVYKYDVDFSKGWVHLENDKASLIILKFPNLDVAPKAIKEHWGYELPPTPRINTMAEKPSTKAYQAAKKQKFPAWYLDKMYSSKFAQKFFTTEEIDSFRKKWVHE